MVVSQILQKMKLHLRCGHGSVSVLFVHRALFTIQLILPAYPNSMKKSTPYNLIFIYLKYSFFFYLNELRAQRKKVNHTRVAANGLLDKLTERSSFTLLDRNLYGAMI